MEQYAPAGVLPCLELAAHGREEELAQLVGSDQRAAVHAHVVGHVKRRATGLDSPQAHLRPVVGGGVDDLLQ